MITVACVLRSGGDFAVEHVERFADAVRRSSPGARVVCLTDLEHLYCASGRVELEPMTRGWPGWWSKIELFRPGLFDGPTLYLDLDTIALGDLSSLYHEAFGSPACLQDFSRPEPEMRARIGSGALLWYGDELASVFETFAGGSRSIIFDHPHRMDHWLGSLGVFPRRLQEIRPGWFVSYKRHCASGVPAGARAVCFHGKPRPWELGADDPIRRLWSGEEA